MKKDNKIALMLIGFLLVLILTFIFCGGLEAVLELLNKLVSVSKEAVESLIDLLDELIDLFRRI